MVRVTTLTSLELSLQAVSGSPALKLVPSLGRLVVLASYGVRVNLRRRTDRRVSEALRHCR
jgi:hypothetical protein